MTTITTRSGKGAPLTNAELDANFTALNAGKLETSATTTDIAEGTNQYFTNARARAALSATGSLSYNSTTGVFSFTQGNTDTVSEGSTNLYFTNGRARSAISATGSLSYNATTGVISYTQPTNISTFTNDSGYLTAIADGSVTPAKLSTGHPNWDASGNVGIGTSSPASPLDIQAANGQSMLRLGATTGTNAVYSRYGNTGGYLYLGRDNSAGTDFGAAYAAGIWSTGAYPMLFGTNGTERIRVTSTGNVGIGSTNPSFKLQVAVASGGNALNITDETTSDFIVKPGISSGVARVGPSTGSMALYTADTERMRIDSSGNVGIGVTPGSWTSSYKALQLNTTGSINGNNVAIVMANNYYYDGTNFKYLTSAPATDYFQYNGTHTWRSAASGTAGGNATMNNTMTLDASGNLVATANVTAYSDERLKKDWAPVESTFVSRLAEVKSGTYTRIDNDLRQAGVSAQSLQEVLPETVMEDVEGMLSVAYGNAALVAAVELAKEVVQLRKRLEALEAK